MEASKLKEILDQHRLWVDGNVGKRALLEDANLTGAYLAGAVLTRAILKGANLEGADLKGASLYGANLHGANLHGANLTHANLGDAFLWGADLTGANLNDARLYGANLTGANLSLANLWGADLRGAILTGAIGLPDVSWVIPGCLVQLNKFKIHGFYLEKDKKYANFVQDSFGFFIQNNPTEGTFDMLVEDRIIRGIPDWVKYSALRQFATESI